ncbi:hypothetical protein ACTWLI_10135 [Arthrobacter sp. Hor0625]|uniref:hypothetical protein n=1 Tax=Arthrobacter sp. Hor0625 TaxID=3457358 RepID=UPI00403E58BC
MAERWIFDGQIAGLGAASGLRAVVGIWRASPFGAFADVMVQTGTGHRLLLAPAADVGQFVAATYSFDEVRIVDVAAGVHDGRLAVAAGPLVIAATVGSRTVLGLGLRAVPRRLAVHPAWLRAINPLAARLSPGTRTHGTAGNGRQESYGVTDLHRITSARVTWNGADQGGLVPITPAVSFGFSSVPPSPSLATVRTTIVCGG